MKKKIAVLTGAGVSAESGFATFRDTGGLWEQYDVQDVASIEGWYRNRKLVLDFYNQRREQLKDAKPNAAHIAIADLEKDYDVDVITQNVDNLHERAGSTRVLHLHGELTKVRPENGHYDRDFRTDQDTPLPSFEGEPEVVHIRGDIDSFTHDLWESLNFDNKGSLFTRFVDLETGKWETRIVNKNTK